MAGLRRAFWRYVMDAKEGQAELGQSCFTTAWSLQELFTELRTAQPNIHATITMIMMMIPLVEVFAGSPCAGCVAFVRIHQSRLNNPSKWSITCSSLTGGRRSTGSDSLQTPGFSLMVKAR